RPQWKSWLVRGADFLVAYSIVVTAWLGFLLLCATSLAKILFWPAAGLAIPTAVFTAFLFSPAKGRDLWQSPLLSIHLLVHALLAGGAVWLMVAGPSAGLNQATPRVFTIVMIWISLATILGEVLTTHPTNDARRAMAMIVGRPLGAWF